MKQQQSIKIFDDLTPEPAYQDVERVMDEAAQYEGDFIIAIGGGSVMDAAKLCSVLKGCCLILVKDIVKRSDAIAEKQIKTVNDSNYMRNRI